MAGWIIWNDFANKSISMVGEDKSRCPTTKTSIENFAPNILYMCKLHIRFLFRFKIFLFFAFIICKWLWKLKRARTNKIQIVAVTTVRKTFARFRKCNMTQKRHRSSCKAAHNEHTNKTKNAKKKLRTCSYGTQTFQCDRLQIESERDKQENYEWNGDSSVC